VIRECKWKLIQYFESENLELYDLSNAPEEMANVATSNLLTVNELFFELEGWQQQTKAAIPRAANSEFDALKEKAAIEQAKSSLKSQKKKKKNRNTIKIKAE